MITIVNSGLQTSVSAAAAGTDGTRESGVVSTVATALGASCTVEWLNSSGATLATQTATVTSLSNLKPYQLRVELNTTGFTFVLAGTVASARVKSGSTVYLLDDSVTLTASITGTTSGILGKLNFKSAQSFDSPTPVTIKNEDATTWTNKGVQFLVTFPDGVIANYPEFLDGSGVPYTLQQVDVRTRYSSGNFKQGLASLVIPSLASGASITPKVRNKTTSNNTATPLATLLNTSFDFDAKVTLNAGGAGLVASARTMMQALTDSQLDSNTTDFSPNSRYLARGPVCTRLYLADHTSKAYDIGAETTKSIRPVFYVNFWPHDNSFDGRVLLENCDTTKLQDCTYSATVAVGSTSPTTVYTRTSTTHFANQIRSKRFRKSNAAAPKVGIKPDLPYLASTKAIPNYDANQSLSSTTRTGYINAWAAAAKDWGNSGTWRQFMGATGATPEIGLMTQKDAALLYDGTYDMREAVEGDLEMFLGFPIFLREGSNTRSTSTRQFDATAGVDAIGRFCTRDARPNAGSVSYLPEAWTSPDTCTLIGTRATATGYNGTTTDAWQPNTSHHPDAGYVAYLVTGDDFYYDLQMWQFSFEQNYLVAATGTATVDPWYYQSGRNAQDCPFNHQQTRSNAWVIRMRAHAASIGRDGSPEKTLALRLMDQGLQAMYGKAIATATTGNVIADWFFNNRPSGWNMPALRYMWETPYPSNSPDESAGMAPWQQHFLTASLRHAAELLPDIAILQTVADHFGKFQKQFATSSYPTYGIIYTFPAKSTSTGNFFQSLTTAIASRSGIAPPAWNDSGAITTDNDGYRNEYSAAVAMLSETQNGWKSWKVIKPNIYDVESWNDGLKWAIVPRG